MRMKGEGKLKFVEARQPARTGFQIYIGMYTYNRIQPVSSKAIENIARCTDDGIELCERGRKLCIRAAGAGVICSSPWHAWLYDLLVDNGAGTRGQERELIKLSASWTFDLPTPRNPSISFNSGTFEGRS